MQLIATIQATRGTTPTLHLPAAVVPTAHHQGALVVATVVHQAVVPLALLLGARDKCQ